KKCIQKANLMLSRLNKTDVDYLYLANLHLGRAYLLAEDFFLAEKYLNKSIEVYENNKDGIYEGKNLGYTYLAELSLKKKEFRKALNECQKGMAVLLNDSTLTDGLDNPGLVKNVRYSHLFELIKIKTETAKQLFLNEKNAAFIELTHQTFQFGIEVLGIMRNESVTTESKQFLLKETLPFYENAIANAIALYKFSGDPKYIDEAFKFNQEGKAILLLERINESKAKIFANIPDSILQKEKMLKQDISFYQKQLFDESLFGENADSLKINLWSEKVFKLKRSLENLNEMLNEQFPRYAELREQPDLPDIGKIQKDLLAENEIFIEYFTGQEQIFTFVITKDQYEVFSLGLEVPVKEQAEALVDQINKPPSASLKEATTNFSSSARDLYNFLIAPFSEKLFDTEKLLIVPHGWLNFIPFELLLTSDASGASFRHLPYLFRSHAINYAPAASIFFDMVKSDKALNNDLLAFAPFYSHPEEPSTIGNSQADLPGAQEEVSALRKYFSGDFYFGKDATETNFKNQANKYGLVHLAMHGSTNTDAPMYAKLDFSPVDDPTEDNQLYAYEIYQLDINSKLVVLSACESGFGQFVHGEGVISLAQSFLQVGAQSVTMSLWEAQDHATQFIMGEYYKGLRDGVAKDRALRTAKLKYLEEPAHQKHPFFWAPFVNIGDPSPIVTPVSYWIWGGLCLLFALVVFAYFRFKSK
ncbi:MAG: CHAT domain-containing protein, partial [Bacteroidota bacterium]